MKRLKECLFVIQQTEYHSLCHKGWGKNYLIKNSRRLQSSPYFCVGQERTRERSIKSPGAEMVKTKGDTCRGSRENLMRNTRRLEH